ncbi:NADPH-dependent 2,4-dienoyl-CoA reductase/sulfur reductase-like enzyme [Pseudonocardia parietis]|uniref:NADPH-dependent 2,4-dienoyl-CoA reductase/sulfur reductase-like enzyme n=1 Tax=Pseudonocardia parietis TaxID=570936 RepID=A0ABS4VUK7_9PSEU|nr:NADPH-dependent 2,4-dienoyl-CoA reductase/sulfur reductase-like enzyme [Pseudonocardia parietis]
MTTLDTGARRAHLDDGTTVGYDCCVLATGSAPVRLPVPGAEGALYLRTLADARVLCDRVGQARSVVVVGSGFIGCEAAVSMALRGCDVTVCSNDRGRRPGPQRRRRSPPGRRALG